MGIPLIAISCYLVALLAEGVDRNIQGPDTEEVLLVALLAEGVDRNLRDSARLDQILLSPSSRRAWIEMYEENDLPRPDHVALLAEGVDRNSTNWTLTGPSTVALLAEGVDRNLDARGRHRQEVKSPSSRRAWIEIGSRFLSCSRSISRPPRGGRG